MSKQEKTPLIITIQKIKDAEDFTSSQKSERFSLE
jgi:hypothetical protein